MREPPRTILIRPDHTLINGCHRFGPLPAAYFAEGLGALLGRIANKIGNPEREAVILLADDELLIPLLGSAALPKAADRAEHPALLDARAAGWTVSELDAWTTFHVRGPKGAPVRPSLHLCILPWIASNQLPPAFGDTPQDRADALDYWHQKWGTPYHHTPGVAALVAMRPLARTEDPRGIRWKLPEDGQVAGWKNAEIQWRRRFWSRPLPPGPGQLYAHTYDITNDYLAAVQSCPLSAQKLTHTGAREFDKSLAGMWRIQSEPWGHADKLPDPAGYGTELHDGSRWVSSRRCALLTELQTAGWHGGFSVLDSWTGRGTQVLRNWAGRCRDLLPDPVIGSAAKASYREGVGMLGHRPSSIERVDWMAQIVGESATKLWRKVWQIGLKSDRWPWYLEYDQATYLAEGADPIEAAPDGMAFANHIGAWRFKGDERNPEVISLAS